jgi:hypothetical protein
MPRAGELSDRIRFERQVITYPFHPDSAVFSWDPEPFLTPAKPERLSEMGCTFTLNYRSDITPASHRIKWEGRIWIIASATHDLKKRTLIIDCDTALVETTHMQSVETEFIDNVPVIRPRE